MTTTVINLFGGSGVGKSTVAALLFARMKIQGLHVELVREYVKLWAWGGRKVRQEDQIYLLERNGPFDPRGRWETAKEAECFDQFLEEGLEANGYDYSRVSGSEEEKVAAIMHDLGVFEYGY